MNRSTLHNGISTVAWSYVFLYFNINLGRVNILPAFVCYWLILRAIRTLQEERRELTLLRPLAQFLLGWNLLDWVLTLAGHTVEGFFPPMELVIGAVSLYFHFQLLTDCAALAQQHQPPQERLDRSIRNGRSIQAVSMTLMLLPGYFGFPWPWLKMALAAVYLLTGLYVMSRLFHLRGLFPASTGTDAPPTPEA